MSDDAVDYGSSSDESDKVPPGSQLERNRAFWRMISASFMQVSDAHFHRRNRRRSASVTRSSATPPRRASSSSSSDTADAGAGADDGDYELEERSAGITPRRRSATGSRAISPAAPRKHTPRKPKSPASPSSRGRRPAARLSKATRTTAAAK